MRIRSHIVLMATAIALPLSVAGAIALQQILDGEREAAQRGLRETVRATALIIDREVQSSLTGLNILGYSVNLETGDLQAFYRQAVNLDRKPNVWTLLLDEQGRMLVNTGVAFGPQTGPPVAAEAVQKVLANQQPLVTGVVTGALTGKMLTGVYTPVAAKGGKALVLAQEFTVEHWKETALHARLPPTWVVAVIDTQGRFIARSMGADAMLGRQARPELVAAAAASSDGLIRHATLEGVDSYDAFTHSSLTGWTIAVAAPVNTIEGAARKATQVALLGMVGALALALLAAAAFGRRFVNAIEHAGLAAVALGKGAIPQVAPTSIEEVDVLNRYLVEAGGLLEQERHSRQLAEAERERLLGSETLARQAAEDENIAKDRFLAMLGHELRNPLAAITGAALVLERNGFSDPRQERFVSIIQRQNKHLTRIVNDLLDVSRLISGKLVLDRRPLDLAACVLACAEALRLTERGAAFTLRVDAHPVWIEGDAVRLEQVLNNLITNAFKFSPAGGEIRVDVGEDGPRAMVRVTDEGSGMAPALVPRVFDPFFQGPALSGYLQSGMGIGLALVKQLVELHGGEVEACSAGPGKGSVFTFWIPRM